LKHQQGPIKFYDLIEAMIRLNIDERSGIHTLVREKILAGNFSRNAYDISIVLAHFGRTLRKNKGIGQ
jgi:hypothetical protein